MDAGTAPRSPKLYAGRREPRETWFPYYAGFSSQFVRDTLDLVNARPGQLVLDPWNGSGTTTSVAAERGLRAVGVDINPAMVVVAKARLIRPALADDALTLAASAVRRSREVVEAHDGDPLAVWLDGRACVAARSLERAIRRNRKTDGEDSLSEIDPVEALNMVGLFAALRSFLAVFRSSNPTWIRRRRADLPPVSFSREDLLAAFTEAVKAIVRSLSDLPVPHSPMADDEPMVELDVGDAADLCLPDESVDLAITSPPYCTRIDYPVTTAVELAVLGVHPDRDLRHLRQKTLGTSTVQSIPPEPLPGWGHTCLGFLDALAKHPSKASRSYYLKTHRQYFGGLHTSVVELDRVLRQGAHCIIVVQDSYYKELHNDLPQIVSEMGSGLGWTLRQRFDYPVARTLSQTNPRARRHRARRAHKEAVLWFVRHGREDRTTT